MQTQEFSYPGASSISSTVKRQFGYTKVRYRGLPRTPPR
jgi:hypothetical protein